MHASSSQHGDLHFRDVKKGVDGLLPQIDIVQRRKQRRTHKGKAESTGSPMVSKSGEFQTFRERRGSKEKTRMSHCS